MSASLGFLQAITGIFVVVYDGQHALKFTLGRAQEVVGPGVHFKLPIVQAFRVEETKHTTLDLEPQVIQLSDDLVYEVDCKVVYQIVDLRKALIEIDDLVTGLRNRVVMAIQHVVQKQDRQSVKDTDVLIAGIREELRTVEEQWGVTILQLGFSNISPSPATLEITQLELLAREKQLLYERFREQGLGVESAVALIAGAVISLEPDRPEESLRAERARELERTRAVKDVADRLSEAEEQRQAERRADDETKPGEEEPPAGSEAPE